MLLVLFEYLIVPTKTPKSMNNKTMPKETNSATTIHVPVSVIELFNKPTNKYQQYLHQD